jgi:hypothetical protein
MITQKRFYFFTAAAILALYGKTLYFGFTWFDDDWLILSQSSYYAAYGNFFKVFSQSIIPWEYCYYRPLLIISFFADFFISNETMSPIFYHLTNIVLHICSVFLLFKLLNCISFSKMKSAAYSLIFACHPVLTQAVAWIPGRNDSLLAVFVLSSFIFYVKTVEAPASGRKPTAWFYIPLCVFFWTAALFTKENAAVLPLLFAVYPFCSAQKINFTKNFVIKAAAFFVLLAAVFSLYFLMRASVLGKFIPAVDSIAIISNIPKILTVYIGKIFIPVNLSAIPFLPDAGMVYGISSAAVLLILFLFVFKITNKRLFYFGLSWFLLFLLPALIPLQSVMLEHRLYLPLIGLIIALGQISIPKLKAVSPKIKISAYSALLIFFFAAAFKHSGAFSDQLTFWQKALSSAPSYYAVYGNLGKVYLESELNLDEAEIYLKKAYEMSGRETSKKNLEKIKEIREAGGIDGYIKLIKSKN